MDIFRSKRTSAHEPLADERPAKRISTPAGQRLSLIIESTNALRSKSPATAKINVTTTSTYCNDPTHQHIGPVQHRHSSTKKSAIVSVLTGGRLNTPRESSEDRTPNGSNLSVIWTHSAKEPQRAMDQEADSHHSGRSACVDHCSGSRFSSGVEEEGFEQVCVIDSPYSPAPSATTGDSQPAGNNPGTSPSSGTETGKPPTPTASLAPSALPSGFPVGAYSFVTFLDTVRTDCTANAATWSCPPSTNYYSDPQKALTILNWAISGSPGSYMITSNGQDPTLGTMFQNEKLDLLDGGKDTERYFFQFSRAKAVNMTGSVGDQKGDFECDYSATTITGSLYTKMGKTYPKDTIAVGNAANPVWPYAARIEQSVGGGDNVPSCKKKSGEKVTDGLKAQDAGTLCSCMYRNWTPPRPYK
ncbi:hypothetical protein CC86DRAFT_387017 [Ophiobolus disseminans]|uniref:Uncharacterized protein n=1 Tax=Ophiobolus disseminans TaxID=1469910 RepID=A0A6A6ZI39_9PLEO|nr:hypothetical protein CC86DRAFT_387017 [Ophiobolus disseminans]